MHAKYFIKNFSKHPAYPLIGVITKDEKGKDCLVEEGYLKPLILKNLFDFLKPDIVFFNSGRWIETLDDIRKTFPCATFFYRTGGNEILKAPLEQLQLDDHKKRQEYWAKVLNNTIDYLITNSDFTQERLHQLNIECPFVKCVGGVDVTQFQETVIVSNKSPIIIFCAARFVPYKNHSLMIWILKNLIERGHDIKLRLAGAGPLIDHIKAQVNEYGLHSWVDFLGVLDNEAVCKEVAQANIYMQLSTDQITSVPGGFYTHSEGMGRSILEAITAGKFVIAGKSGALPEIITPDRGLLIDLNDHESAIYEIEKVLNNLPEQRPITNEYSWDNIFKRYEALFEGGTNENIINYRKV